MPLFGIMQKTYLVPEKTITAPRIFTNKSSRKAVGFMSQTYQCSRCHSVFPESKPPMGRTVAETRRLEREHTAREFALHVCAERGWPPVKRLMALTSESE
jgi:hypothetical protein